MKKFLVFLCAVMLLVATCLVVSTTAFAVPVVDGFLDGNEYNNSFTAGWYNGHNQVGSQFKKADDHMTTVYWESTGNSIDDGNFYLYLEAPLEAKNMIWGDGFTEEEALLYYQHWASPPEGETAELDGSNATHHKDGFDVFKNKTDFATMTGSEKVIFGQGPLKIDKNGYEVFDGKDFKGVKADLAGDATGTFYGNILDYKDSVDYVILNNLGDMTNSDASNIPMAFEFMFGYLTQSEIDTLISDIQSNELEFHLSPERGAPVPEPATILLIGTGLVGFAVPRIRKRLKK